MCFHFQSQFTFAQDEVTTSVHPSWTSFEYPNDPKRVRNAILSPFLSYFLPGLDQWIEGQYRPAVTYSSLGVSGLLISYATDTPKSSLDLNEKDSKSQFRILGGSMYALGGGLSAYHSFRSAAMTNWQESRYHFLKDNPDSMSDIWLSPFKFSYLSEWTTWVPFGAEALLFGLALALDKDGPGGFFLRPRDVAFSGAYSYSAGVNEEAAFRGYLFPAARHISQNVVVGNLVQSLIFAGAHYPRVKFPIIQFGLGYYFGFLTERNHWSITQSAFIHTWWDIIAFLVSYAVTPNSTTSVTIPVEFRF